MAVELRSQMKFGEYSEITLPPLENGDRLTRDEFERRYQAMPAVKKAELIDGVMYYALAGAHLHMSNDTLTL